MEVGALVCCGRCQGEGIGGGERVGGGKECEELHSVDKAEVQTA